MRWPRVFGASDDMSFDELLISSDVISIHTPLAPETRHLIDRRALARMKRIGDSRSTPPAARSSTKKHWPGR